MSSHATGGPETVINTSSYLQFATSISALDGGGWLVTFTCDNQGSDGEDIYQVRYDSKGVASDAAVRVNSYATGDQSDSHATALSDGGWVVTWASDNQDGDGIGVVYQQRYTANGSKLEGETLVTSYTAAAQLRPSTTGLADGGWVVSWTSAPREGSNSAAIYQQRYDAAGDEAGSETLVETYTTGLHDDPAVTALSDGGWLVTWTSYGQGGIYQQRYTSEGATDGGETPVNTSLGGDLQHSSVTVLADGGWIVAWTSSAGQDGSWSGIYQQRFDADGEREGSETRVNSTTLDFQLDAAVAALADGGWIVVWESNASRESSGGEVIYQQRYRADGDTLGNETLVQAATSEFQTQASVTALADGGWVVGWTTTLESGEPAVIRQRHFAADVVGSALADSLRGSDWDESLIGFSGNDTLNGKTGDDVMVGGYGNDIYVVNSKGDCVQELPGQGIDTVKSSIDFTLGGSVERLMLTGSTSISGTGNGLANIITGNTAANRLSGAGGNDTLIGGKGVDTLSGGQGADLFLFKPAASGPTKSTADIITDFTAADHIDLSAIDANASSRGNQTFKLINTAFTGHAGELRADKLASDTWIYGDMDGDRKADLVIHLDDAVAMTTDYFVL